MKKAEAGKPVVWLRGEVKTPPFSQEARRRLREYDRLVGEGEGQA